MTLLRKLPALLGYSQCWYIMSFTLFLCSIFIFYVSITDEMEHLFNADMLYLPSLYKDLFVDKFSIEGWSLTPSPYFFPDMVIFFLLMFVTKNFVISTYLYGVVQALILIVLISLLCRELFSKVSWQDLTLINIIGILIIDIALIFYNNFFYLIHHLFIPTAHFGAFVMTILSLLLSLKCIKNLQSKYLVCIFVVVILTSISDKMFIVMYVLPMILVTIMAVFFKLSNKRHSIYLATTILLASVISVLIFRILKLWLHIGEVQEVDFKSGLTMTVWVFIKEIKGDEIPFSFFLVFLLSFLQSMFLLKRLVRSLRGERGKQRIEKDRLFFLHLLFSVTFMLIVLTVPIVTGLYVNRTSTRYIVSIVFLGLFNLGIYLLYFIRREGIRIKLKYVKSALLCLLFLFLLLCYKYYGNERVYKLFYYQYPAAKCLDEKKEEYDLKYGLSKYWHAKPLTMFSKRGIRVYQVTPYLAKFYWINNGNWYLGEENSRFPNPEYNFVVLDGLDGNIIVERFGDPDVTFSCGKFKIWVYNDNEEFKNQFKL